MQVMITYKADPRVHGGPAESSKPELLGFYVSGFGFFGCRV